MKPIFFALLASVLAACSSAEPSATSGSTVGGSSGTGGSHTSSSTSSSGAGGGGQGGSGGAGAAKACVATTFGGSRPATLHVPKSYDCGKGAPLLVMLHGYSASGNIEEIYLKLAAESDKRGFLYIHPDGTKDSAAEEFWNATDACCNLYGSKVDDSAYITSLIDEIEAKYSVDPRRVYLFGHSNGAFMSYRMACEHGDRIAGIVSLAGAMWEDVTKCPAKTPVSVLEIHGTADAVIAYDGSAIAGKTYPSAPTSVADWATIDGCMTPADTTAAPMDLEATLPGDETTVANYKDCAAGTHVSLWSIQGGAHVPALSMAFIPSALDFLYAQSKP